MLFNSFEFALFFALVLGAIVALPRRLEPRILLGASLLFYSLWTPILIVLLLGTIGANYALVRRMTVSRNPGRYLAASVLLCLSVLGYFKYGAFFADLARSLAGTGGAAKTSLSTLALPLGISFYTFELISLSVDIRRGRLPCPSFTEYLLFVSFFPHLIAGPIIRGEELVPQLAKGGERTAARSRRGLWLFASGLFKKTFLSDYLLLTFVNGIFSVPKAFDGPTYLVAMYSFAFQIYFDFSGYSDMARGIACLLGYELPLNFEEPYLSRDPSEFWQRWHMTLSRWLRDYLYVPLGGNRRGPVRTAVNLVVTMVLGGLWHGAGLNFLLWGLLHGLVLVAYRLVRGRHDTHRPFTWSDLPRALLMFHVVCLLWVPFRAATWADTTAFVHGLFFAGGYRGTWPLVRLGVVGLCGALHVLERSVRTRLPGIHARMAEAWWGPAFEGAALGTALTVSVLASGTGVQFVYFQF